MTTTQSLIVAAPRTVDEALASFAAGKAPVSIAGTYEWAKWCREIHEKNAALVAIMNVWFEEHKPNMKLDECVSIMRDASVVLRGLIAAMEEGRHMPTSFARDTVTKLNSFISAHEEEIILASIGDPVVAVAPTEGIPEVART